MTGQRRRDVRNGFSVPPKLAPRTMLDIARRPDWWLNLITTEQPVFATIPAGGPEADVKFIDDVIDPGVSFADLAMVRKAADHGADAVVLAAHGDASSTAHLCHSGYYQASSPNSATGSMS